MKALAAASALALLAAGQTPPQEDRAAQQKAYQQWHQTDPNLERDANSAGATLGARADKVAAEAANYLTIHKNDLATRAADAGRSASLLEPVDVAPDAPPNLDRFLTAQDTLLRASMTTIAANSDRAIQQLRSALERERNAMRAVAAAVKESQKSQDAAVQTARTAEEVRVKASDDYAKLTLSLHESEQLADKSAVAWAGYYRALSDAARAAAAPSTSAGPALPSAGRSANPAGPPSPPAVPLPRFLGAWTYPTEGAHYHGPQPEWVALTVKEQNGRGSGTLTARFTLPPGSTGNPLVRLDFSGAFGNSRVQTFAVTTSGGETGTLELIPGPAFNLLEVNFSIGDKPGDKIGDKPGTIRQGNFLLVKQ